MDIESIGQPLLTNLEKLGKPLEGISIGKEVSEETRRSIKEIEANIRHAEEKSGSLIVG